uniref:T-box domain-containing protein n=1 Tax=Caenorhabditis japonica TaxID=281687 RepID=A0A8R1IYH1_CAEJA
MSSFSILSASLITDNQYTACQPHEMEMIVSKKGKPIFPRLEFKLSGLLLDEQYQVLISLERADKNRYCFTNGKWRVSELRRVCPQEEVVKYVNYGSDDWIKGEELMSKDLIFNKLRITNYATVAEEEDNTIHVNTMHKYVPVLTVIPLHSSPKSWHFHVASFIPVTTYCDMQLSAIKVY